MPNSLAERIYYASPVWAQNVAFTLKGWQLRRRRYARHFHEHLARLKESENWDAERIAAFKDEHVRRIVAHAYQHTPFYREFFDAHGVGPQEIRGVADLPRLPLLSKQTVRDRQADMIESSWRGRVVWNLTSGTTGTPICVRLTPEAAAMQWAVWWRHRARFGLKFGDRHLMFGARVPIPADQKRPPFWRHDRATNRVYLSTYHLTPAHLPAIADWLDTQLFDFYTGYPSAMAVLAAYYEDSGRTPRSPPRVIVTGSDALLPAFEQQLARVFKCPITETWGMVEFAANLSKCEHGRFHEDFEIGHIEALPLEGDAAGVVKLVCTGWGNPLMPFIRYDVGDYARVAEGACTCGRASATFLSVEGRTEDYIRTRDGRMAIGMNQVLEYARGAREIQIYQPSLDDLVVRVVPGPGYAPGDEQAVLRELRRRLGDQIIVRFERVAEIPRSGSGKFRAVVSDVAPVGATAEALHAATRS